MERTSLFSPMGTVTYSFLTVKYEGVSKIIRTVGTCWLGMTKYTWFTPLLPLWCRCDLDSPFLSCVFAINMDTPNFICTKEEQRAVIHFCGLKVYVPGVKMHRMMSVQYGNSVMSTDCLLIQREVQKWSHKR
jgi:hypothetical protein